MSESPSILKRRANLTFVLTVAAGAVLHQSSCLQRPPETPPTIANRNAQLEASEAKPLRTLHVAPGGDDSAASPTDEATPLRTIGRAAELARAGDLISIAAGTYRETVRVRSSGTEKNPIVFSARPGERVVVSGTEVIETEWQADPDRDHVFFVDLQDRFESSLNQGDQVFVDGRMWDLARHPDFAPEGDRMQPGRWFTIDKGISKEDISGKNEWGDINKGGAVRVVVESDDLVEPDGYWDDATIWIKPEQIQSWGFGRIGPIRAYKKGRIEFDIYDRSDSFFHFTPGIRFYLFDDIRALSAPGEWWLDKEANRLFLRVAAGADPNQLKVEVKRRDYAFDVSEQSYVVLKQLNVFGATITTDAQSATGVGGGAWLTGDRGSVDRPDLKGNAPAHHIVLDAIDARYISHFEGTWGNPHGQWNLASGIQLIGEDHVLKNSIIAHSAGNGVTLFGLRHAIVNNVIHDVNYTAAHAAAIMARHSAGNAPEPHIDPTDYEIANNTLYRGGWSLIESSNLYSSGDGSLTRIHHNLLDAPAMLTKDAGGIRFVGHRDEPPLPNGTRIDHNVVRNCVAALCNAIYFDFSNGYVADHNVVYDSNSGININDGGNLLVLNNTLQTLQGGIGGVVRDNDEAWRLRDVVVKNNVTNQRIIRRKGSVHPTYLAAQNLTEVDFSKLVRDPAHGDFSPKSGSDLIDSGVKVLPFTSGYEGKAPDIGAIEAGGRDWAQEVGAKVVDTPAPTQLRGQTTSQGHAHLRWKDPSGGQHSFVIERGYKTDHPNGGWEYVIAGRADAGQTSYVDAPSVPYMPYFYRVRTENSFYSNTVTVSAGLARVSR